MRLAKSSIYVDDLDVVERAVSRPAKPQKAARMISRVKATAEAGSSRKLVKAAPVRTSTRKVSATTSAPAKKAVQPAAKKVAIKPVRISPSRKVAALKK